MERAELRKKLSAIEDSYKRDTELFRTEAMKRDQDVDLEKVRIETELV